MKSIGKKSAIVKMDSALKPDESDSYDALSRQIESYFTGRVMAPNDLGYIQLEVKSPAVLRAAELLCERIISECRVERTLSVGTSARFAKTDINNPFRRSILLIPHAQELNVSEMEKAKLAGFMNRLFGEHSVLTLDNQKLLPYEPSSNPPLSR